MSIVFPYGPTAITDYLTNLFSTNLSELTPFESIVITLISNIYFFIFWFFIIYFALKIFNRIWERFF